MAVVGLVGIGVGLGLANRGQAEQQTDQVVQTLRDQSARREAQDSCATKINAQWNAAFGQAAISPVGSPQRLEHAIEAARVLPHLQAIDVECYGTPATTSNGAVLDTTTPITTGGG